MSTVSFPNGTEGARCIRQLQDILRRLECDVTKTNRFTVNLPKNDQDMISITYGVPDSVVFISARTLQAEFTQPYNLEINTLLGEAAEKKARILRWPIPQGMHWLDIKSVVDYWKRAGFEAAAPTQWHGEGMGAPEEVIVFEW